MGNTQLSEEIKRLFQEFGKQGGETTKRKYGTAHFAAAGKLGMAQRWGKKNRLKRAAQQKQAAVQQ